METITVNLAIRPSMSASVANYGLISSRLGTYLKVAGRRRLVPEVASVPNECSLTCAFWGRRIARGRKTEKLCFCF